MPIGQTEWVRLGRLAETWRRPLLLSHIRPDGDAIGALLAMTRLCRSFGAEPILPMYDELPARYAGLAGSDRIVRWPDAALALQPDSIIILDTCSWNQLEPAAEYLKQSPLPRIIVDHHKTRDSLVGTVAASAEYATDDTASAASLLVHEWARAAGWLNRAGVRAAEALFVGISSDTGWFRFSNTDARTMTAAGELIAVGVRPDVWYAAMYESASPARTRLEGAMLAAMKSSDEGRLVWSILTQEMFHASGASRSDTEDMIQGLQRMSGVVVSVLFAEEPDGKIRASLRSKSPEVCGRDIDVAAIASSLGGGGHARAAGVRIVDTMEAVQQKVLSAVREKLSNNV